MKNVHLAIPEDFTPVPSLNVHTALTAVATPTAEIGAVGYPVTPDGDLPAGFAGDWAGLTRHGFTGAAGQTFVVAQFGGADQVLIGLGTPKSPTTPELTVASLRNAVAALVRAVPSATKIAFDLGNHFDVPAQTAGTAIAESAILARYAYTTLKTKSKHVELSALEIVCSDPASVAEGFPAARALARAATVARDLANTPPGHLTASDMAEFAEKIGPDFGLEVAIADRAELLALGCGGLLGVNAGSTQEPRMVTLKYVPAGEPTAHVALVGKGIMYDSGGISLKPSDQMHLLMKLDMAGAGAILGAMTSLKDLGVTSSVTAFLMCTDNMPSGSAIKLGDVLTIRNGTTVEVKNTDAEGRLVMSDALCLAHEDSPDAIVDVATLTGATLMALGTSTAAAFGNDRDLMDQVIAASNAVDEPAWQLPLDHSYRSQLDSDIADISNMGGRFAGATTAALFLHEFVGEIPWVHLDIAGTMNTDTDNAWRSKGATGYGARLLADFLTTYRA